MRHIKHATLAALACGFALVVTATGSAQSDQLILESPGGALAVTPPRHTRNIEHVGVNFDLLESLRVHDGFTMTIYGDDLLAIVDEVKPQAEGYTVRGHFDRSFKSFFTITVVGDAAAGTFHIPGARDLVRLRYGGPDGLHYLHEVEIGPEDECAGEALVPFKPGEEREAELMDPDRRLSEIQTPPNADPLLLGGCGPTDPTFDVMLIYSDDARVAAGGTNAIRAECIDAVEVMELTYLTCSVLIRTNIVYLAEVSYNESGRSYQNHLDSLIDPDDGILDGIHSTRDSVDADFVSLIVADDESGGLGRCSSNASDAMSVCNWTVVADNFTLAHEVGHNIGCGHDPVTGDNCGWEIGWGHFFFVPVEGMWRHTVMSYRQNNSTRIPYYSTPSCDYEGIPTGTSTRDNLAVILSRQYTVEAFRRTRMDVWVDFGYGGHENGSNAQPYNTVIEGVNRTLPSPVADIPILHIKPGSRAEAVTINKPMIIDACGGTVTIGR